MPGIQIAAPRDAENLRELLPEAVNVEDAPTVVRFPKGTAPQRVAALRREPDGVDVLHEADSKDVLFVGVGPMASIALEAAKLLESEGIGATVLDPRWVVPVPRSVLDHASSHRIVITIEDGIRVGGIGTRVRQDLRGAGIDTALTELGVPDEFLPHASRAELLEYSGLTPQQIASTVAQQVRGDRIPVARQTTH